MRHCQDTEQVDSFALVILRKYVLRGAPAITEDIADGFGNIAHYDVVGGIRCVGEQLAGLDCRFQRVGLGGGGELLLSLNRVGSVGLGVLVAHGIRRQRVIMRNYYYCEADSNDDYYLDL